MYLILCFENKLDSELNLFILVYFQCLDIFFLLENRAKILIMLLFLSCSIMLLILF